MQIANIKEICRKIRKLTLTIAKNLIVLTRFRQSLLTLKVKIRMLEICI